MQRLLSLYAKQQTSIEMIYLAKSGQITQRKVSLLQLNGQSVFAYCHLRNRKRTFILENILSFVPLKDNRNTLSS
ncbi:putative DNA-binding transcriptional regulator YafY [Bacillus tianshenii]|uniref:DNA-binding transcriptional regulator YafY n=1 Tax=Sutcliffiella tianshenii TaxID=1463404 RepID=A0ABS2P6M1_9BACI|nr:hypothetical protein [Bacillus tianshenii]MBM7622055.1 putative DNA-binding transcriptional regulator YafY [Bacillus tianshenii]